MAWCYGFKAFDGVEFTAFKDNVQDAMDVYLGERLGHAVENNPHMTAEAFEATRAAILEFAMAQKWYRRLKINIHRE